MREHSGSFFVLLAVPFIVTLALLAALQPVAPVSAAAPSPAIAPYFPHPGHPHARNGPSRYPDNRGAVNGMAPYGGPRNGFRHRPPYGRYGYPGPGARRPVGDITLDGWRLLAALAVGGGFAGLAWSAANRQGSGVPAGTSSVAGAQEIVLLREEVDRLRSEQRQLRAAVDWQERLLAEVNRPAIPPEV